MTTYRSIKLDVSFGLYLKLDVSKMSAAHSSTNFAGWLAVTSPSACFDQDDRGFKVTIHDAKPSPTENDSI